jgi:hypothetical protein
MNKAGLLICVAVLGSAVAVPASAQPARVLTPHATGVASGSAYFPMQAAFDAQPTLDGAGQPVGGTGGSDAPYYANRVGYIDFGPDWSKVRISATWTRYRVSSVGDQTPYAELWWDDDDDTLNDSGMTETRLNFNTAQGLSTGSQEPWIRDRDLSASPVTPRARYLVARTPAVMTNRAKEYAIIGWTAAAPLNTFTLPYPSSGDLYLPDVQKSHPGVDWATLDRLYLSAGHYGFIKLGNLPARSPERPLVITNKGGQVRVGGTGHYYLFVMEGGSNWKLTGEFDAGAQTGAAAFPGHKGNNYGNTRGTYGILIDDDFYPGLSNSGLAIGNRATDFEVSYLEIREVGFAGINMKSNDDGTALMRNVRLHDLYIHDTGSEGFYIGSTKAPPQHPVEGLEIYNCRVLRTGTDALQLGQLGTGTNVHHNVFALSAIDWKAAFQPWQDNNTQIAVRYGRGAIHHNIFIGAAGSMISFFGQVREGDVHAAGDGLTLHDNYYSSFRGLGTYLGGDPDGVSAYRFERNVFRAFSWQRQEVYPQESAPRHLFRVALTQNPVVLQDNRFDMSFDLTNRFAGENGASGNVVATGNTRGVVAPVAFNDFGFPPDFDYLRVELWTATCSRCSDPSTPVYYQPGDYVLHHGVLYRNISGGPVTQTVPGTAPQVWESLGFPPDDVRLAPGSPYQGLGLLDRLP